MAAWDADVIVVGAGVAGSSAALLLGREGYRVLLLDRATFPRHKTCGEGIMPEGVAILDSLGLMPDLRAAGSGLVGGLRFRSHDGTWAEAAFPPVAGRPACSLVIRRYELDHLLLQRAAALPNVTVREGFTVSEAVYEDGTVRGVIGRATGRLAAPETLRAPLTLAADGMHSKFHNRYGIVKTVLRRQRWGIAGHLAGMEGTEPYIEVFFQEGNEIYVAPLAGDLVLVAILVEKSGMGAFQGNLPVAYERFLQAAPGLSGRLGKGEVLPPVAARGPLGFRVDPVYRPGLLLLGDSAGFLDPITGEGMTLALKSVQAAVPIVRRALASGDVSDAILAPYAAERARITYDVYKLTQLMLDITRYPVLANRAVRRLARDTALFQKLLGIVTGTSRYRDFGLRDRLALALG
jgi:menaquinone-9 beta-reductase